MKSLWIFREPRWRWPEHAYTAITLIAVAVSAFAVLVMRDLWLGSKLFIGMLLVGIIPIIWLQLRLRRLGNRLRSANGWLCTNCLYDLHGLSESGTCPECGRPFHAAESRVYWAKSMNMPELLSRDDSDEMTQS